MWLLFRKVCVWGINQYLKGYLPEENIRIRPESIKFEIHLQEDAQFRSMISFNGFSKKFGGDGFSLKATGGNLREGEVLGIVGPNGIGKSTFVKVLAGEIKPDEGDPGIEVKISYKPQYIKADIPLSVQDFLRGGISKQFGSSYYEVEISNPLQLEKIYDSLLTDLSGGGELQRVAVAACLSQEADLYILDEPSAHLDVEQRSMVTKVINRFAENNQKTALVVDHDIYMIDMLSQRLLVFEGEPSVYGEAHGPFSMEGGMNRFLKNLGITFRRDEETRRPPV